MYRIFYWAATTARTKGRQQQTPITARFCSEPTIKRLFEHLRSALFDAECRFGDVLLVHLVITRLRFMQWFIGLRLNILFLLYAVLDVMVMYTKVDFCQLIVEIRRRRTRSLVILIIKFLSFLFAFNSLVGLPELIKVFHEHKKNII